jgi:hypothetical protein
VVVRRGPRAASVSPDGVEVLGIPRGVAHPRGRLAVLPYVEAPARFSPISRCVPA